MDHEDKLVNQIKQYQDLAKENPNIDVSALVLNAFQNSSGQQNFISKREKHWAYIISMGFPPFGLIFALKFWTGGKADGKSAAWMCIALTIFAVICFFAFFQGLISSSGLSGSQINQIQQLKPQDIYQTFQ